MFAETLDQHNRNVARWREIERERQEAAPVPVDRAAPDDSAAPVPSAPRQPQRRSEAPAHRAFGGLAAPVDWAAASARDIRSGPAASPWGADGFRTSGWGDEPAPLTVSSYLAAPIASALLPTSLADLAPATGGGRTALRAIAAQAPVAAPSTPVTAFAPVPGVIEAGVPNFSGFDRTRRSAAAARAAVATAESEAVDSDAGLEETEAEAAPATMKLVPVSSKRLTEMESRAARYRNSAEAR